MATVAPQRQHTWFVTVVLGVLTLLPAAPATAGPPANPVASDAFFSNAGAWEIRRGDASVGRGCYAITHFEPDIVLIVGMDLAQNAAFLNVGSPRLQPVDPTKRYTMQVQFEGYKPRDSRAEVGISDKVKFMMMTFRDGDFLNEFMHAKGMTLREPGKDGDKDVLRLNLTRSGSAGVEVLRCQKGVNPLAGGEVAATKSLTAPSTR